MSKYQPYPDRYKKMRVSAGLRLAIRESAKRAGQPEENQNLQGRKYLAEALHLKTETIRHWKKIPKGHVMMVHIVTGIPLAKLAPELFK